MASESSEYDSDTSSDEEPVSFIAKSAVAGNSTIQKPSATVSRPIVAQKPSLAKFASSTGSAVAASAVRVVATRQTMATTSGRLVVSKPRKAVGAVNSKHMPVERAEAIWTSALDKYKELGMYSDTDANGRQEFMWLIAEMFVAGTSRETDYSAYAIESTAGTVTALPLVDACVAMHIHHNPVRAFFRSFRDGTIPQMMRALLSNPDNAALRGTQQLAYACGESDIQFAFDLADTLVMRKIAIASEIVIIQNLKQHALVQARVNAQASGLVRPVQDSSQATRQTFAGTTPGTNSTSLPTSGSSRMNFGAVSSLM